MINAHLEGDTHSRSNTHQSEKLLCVNTAVKQFRSLQGDTYV
jgi:hypothetical protein